MTCNKKKTEINIYKINRIQNIKFKIYKIKLHNTIILNYNIMRMI